jgi:hypothetical protein
MDYINNNQVSDCLKNDRDFDSVFALRFGLVALTCNRFLLDYMRRIGPGIGMDLEAAMVWGFTAHLAIGKPDRPNSLITKLMNGDGRFECDTHSVPLSDIVQVSCLPKSVVIKKLRELERLGKVKELDRDEWEILQAGVDRDAYIFTLGTVKRFLRTAREIEKIMSDV